MYTHSLFYLNAMHKNNIAIAATNKQLITAAIAGMMTSPCSSELRAIMNTTNIKNIETMHTNNKYTYNTHYK